MRDEDFHEDDDWDEEDWERFLQKADVRNAKYMELCVQKFGGAKFISEIVSEADSPWRTDSRNELNL